MRLFVAIEMNDEVRRECRKVMESLEGSGADIRTVSMENLHITLKFLGEVREDKVKEISDRLRELSGRFEPFRITLSMLGYFGGARFPRVVWAGISDGRETVSRMATELNGMLSHVRDDGRETRPHLTLARVRSPRNSGSLVEKVRELRHVKLGEVEVKEIRLKSSLLQTGGPIYSDIGVFGLGKAGT